MATVNYYKLDADWRLLTDIVWHCYTIAIIYIIKPNMGFLFTTTLKIFIDLLIITIDRSTTTTCYASLLRFVFLEIGILLFNTINIWHGYMSPGHAFLAD